MVKRNTKQKRLVMETLGGMNHPSATSVYEEVRRKDPTVSRATVFRILADAAGEGILLRLMIPGSDDRFDFTLAKHCHIRCRVCGRVDDVKVDEAAVKSLAGADAHGYRIEGCDVEFVGLCPGCTAAENDKKVQQ